MEMQISVFFLGGGKGELKSTGRLEFQGRNSPTGSGAATVKGRAVNIALRFLTSNIIKKSSLHLAKTAIGTK